jgi:uroporphyrinogen-III decarboxylase
MRSKNARDSEKNIVIYNESVHIIILFYLVIQWRTNMEIAIPGKYALKIDRERIAEARDRCTKYYNKQKVDRLPFCYYAGTSKCPPYSIGDMVRDPDKLIEHTIARINGQTETFPDTDYLPYFGTWFYGQGVVASMFGAKQLIDENMPVFTEGRVMQNIYDLDKLPRRINPETDGWGPKLKDVCEKFLDAVHGEIPVLVSDHQSTYGTATKICDNEELMLAMYDEPEMVHEFFGIVTTAIEDTIDAMEKWCGKNNLVKNEAVPVPGKNGVIIWDDYISVITPSLHTEFCAPYNIRLYEKYGRGHLHTCGPYFNGYIDACVKCKPISLDCSIMRGFACPKEDMLEFRRITKEAGIILMGSPDHTSSPIFDAWGQPEKWGEKDDAYLRYMAQGGLFYRILNGDGKNNKEDGKAKTKHWHELTRDLVNIW